MIGKIDNIIFASASGLTITFDTDVSSATNLNNITFQRLDNLTYTILPLNSCTVSGNTITVTFDQLIPDKLYTIELFYVYSGVDDGLIEYQLMRFLAINDISFANPNNIYTKLQNLDGILSVENLVKNDNPYTLVFNPTIYNSQTGTYETLPNEITIKNNEEILNLLINQYFTEYETFYTNINNRDEIKTQFAQTYTDDYIKQLNLVFLKNIVKFYALKGTKYLIELMLGLNAKYLGYFLVSVVEDLNQNFVYRVTSSIPETLWNTDIKPFVHPLSWDCVYSEISNTGGLQIELINIRRLMRETWLANWDILSTSYLEAEMYSRGTNKHFKKLKNFYHLSGNVLAETVSAHDNEGHINCVFQNVHDEAKINLNFNGNYHGTLDYQQNELLHTLKDIKNVGFVIDRFNKTIDLDYGYPGIAHQYIWKVYDVNTNQPDIYESVHSFRTIEVPDYNRFIELTIKNNLWSHTVHRYDFSAFDIFKQLRLSAAINVDRPKFLDVRCFDNKAGNINGISANSFTDEKNFQNLSITNDFNYTFMSPSLSADFVNEFDNVNLYEMSLDPNGGNHYNITLKYTNPGLAYKYLWYFKYNGQDVFKFETYLSEVKFAINQFDFESFSFQLKLVFKDESEYALTSHTLQEI